MSGVYIPDMKIPRDCTYCPCFNGISGWCNADESLIRPKDTYKRHPDCPLIPVPDHGRLIDADAFLEDLLFPTKEFERGMRELVADTPTIIPADKEIHT